LDLSLLNLEEEVKQEEKWYETVKREREEFEKLKTQCKE
jgi:hypothetical protein